MIKRFFIYLTISLAGALLLVGGFHLLLRNGFKKQQNDFFSIMNHVLEEDDNHEILALGASLTRNNISTQVLDSIKKVNSYNAGIFAFGLVETKMMLECYLKSKHPKPNMVLLTMPENMAFKKEEIVFPAQFYPYVDNDIIYKTLAPYDEKMKRIRHFPIASVMEYDDHLKYVALIPYIKPNHAKPNVYKGFDALEGSIANPEKFAKSTLKEEQEFKVDKQQFQYFQNFCGFCHEQGIVLKIILTPTFNPSGEAVQAPMAGFLKPFENTLHFTLLDFTSDSLRLNKQMYYDRLHLNGTGARILTKKIAEKI